MDAAVPVFTGDKDLVPIGLRQRCAGGSAAVPATAYDYSCDYEEGLTRLMLRFLPFAQEHVQHIKLMFDLSEDGRKALVEHKDIRGYTLFEEDVVLGIGGVHNIWNGVGEAWLLLGKEAFARPRTVARHTVNMFDHMQEEHQYQRIQPALR